MSVDLTELAKRHEIASAFGYDSDCVHGIHLELARGDKVLLACFFPRGSGIIRAPRAGDPPPYRLQVTAAVEPLLAAPVPPDEPLMEVRV